jgi:hypothetical protein
LYAGWRFDHFFGLADALAHPGEITQPYAHSSTMYCKPARPDGNRGGGKANQSSSNNSYREPPLASNWKPIGDVAAMLVRRLDAAAANPNSLMRRKESPAWGRASSTEG